MHVLYPHSIHGDVATVVDDIGIGYGFAEVGFSRCAAPYVNQCISFCNGKAGKGCDRG